MDFSFKYSFESEEFVHFNWKVTEEFDSVNINMSLSKVVLSIWNFLRNLISSRNLCWNFLIVCIRGIVIELFYTILIYCNEVVKSLFLVTPRRVTRRKMRNISQTNRNCVKNCVIFGILLVLLLSVFLSYRNSLIIFILGERG